MRPRTELAIGVAALAVLVFIAAAAGRRDRPNLGSDFRVSATVADPRGLKALAAVIERLGGRVTLWRQRPQRLTADIAEGATLVVASPMTTVTSADVVRLLDINREFAHLLVAGASAEPLLRCFGYAPRLRLLDSVTVRLPSGAAGRGVFATIHPIADSLRTLSADLGQDAPCPAVTVARVDTLLRSSDDSLVAVKLTMAEHNHAALLISDAGVLANEGLRSPNGPELLIEALLSSGPHVVFDEYHQSGRGGPGLGQVTLSWSRSSPWGWAIWQLAIVGLLAYFAGAWRWGPIRQAIERKRRSPLEHVRALATALAASNGHDVAIAAMIRGLQRRLTIRTPLADRSARAAHERWQSWLDRLPQRIPDPATRERAERLRRITQHKQDAAAVHAAANHVEDLWEALHT